MIEVDNLWKFYGSFAAVRDVSFSVDRGEVVGVLGPNGAGKTTTLRMLAGYLTPSRGRVRIGGCDTLERPLAARRQLGYMPESAPSYPELSVTEYLQFRAELKGVPRKRRSASVQSALQQAGVTEVARSLIGQLSKGYRQRVGLADALVARPPLLILDEPTAGLDPNQIRQVRALIRELRSDHTVLLSTHIMSEVDSVCDRALVIDGGSVLAEGSLEALKQAHAPRGFRLLIRGRTADCLPRLEQALQSQETPASLRALQISVLAPVDPADDLGAYRLLLSDTEPQAKVADWPKLAQALLNCCVTHHLPVVEFTREASSLEEVFVKLTREQPAEPSEPGPAASPAAA